MPDADGDPAADGEDAAAVDDEDDDLAEGEAAAEIVAVPGKIVVVPLGAAAVELDEEGKELFEDRTPPAKFILGSLGQLPLGATGFEVPA